MRQVRFPSSPHSPHSPNCVRCVFLLYLEAIAVHNATASQSTAASAAEEGAAPDASLAFSARDLREIAQLHANYQGHLFELLAASFCPTIFGHEVVKVIATDEPCHIWA